ncbi:MAG TPA: aminoacetone oxidase family FAD-binding enzyme, partial [Isosphaeraceae bacterium]|nr:aminoacetone oxidase family FAD-binding enzyme [Isosphaeraceae bacterium]
MADVAILGAGAAGLFAAISAAERGRTVVLLEKNHRPGVKILMSGGTRCNITNARGLRNLRVVSGPIDPAYNPREARGARSIQQAFEDAPGRFLSPALKAFSVEDSVSFFESEGVATKVEGNGKVFPVSDRAVDVLSAILGRLERSGAVLLPNSPAQEIIRSDAGFSIRTPDRSLDARRVVVTVGGQSYPGSGTSGDGYTIARAFGHTIVEPRPALVPLKVTPEWVTGLKGLTLTDVHASIRCAEGPALQERREAVLFAHFGLTGPAILDVSRAVARHDSSEGLFLHLDLVPDLNLEQLDARLASESRSGRSLVANHLSPSIPKRLVEILLDLAQIPRDRIGPELSKVERRRLV